MKNLRKIAQDGFSHVELALILFVVAALIGAGVLVYKNNSTSHAGSLNYHYMTTVTRKDQSMVSLFGCYQAPGGVVSSSSSSSVSSTSNPYQHIYLQAYVYPSLSVPGKNYELKLTDYYFTTQTWTFSKTSNGLMANLTLTDINNVPQKTAGALATLTSSTGSTTTFKFNYKTPAFACSVVDPTSSEITSVPSASSYVTSETVSNPVSVFVNQM